MTASEIGYILQDMPMMIRLGNIKLKLECDKNGMSDSWIPFPFCISVAFRYSTCILYRKLGSKRIKPGKSSHMIP